MEPGAPVRGVLAVKVEAGASGVEECEVAKREHVRQAQDLAVEALGARDVADGERDLADGAEARGGRGGHGRIGPPAGKGCGVRNAGPMAQLAGANAELAADVGEVVLHGVH
jgi:hypothetical protein